MEPGFGGFGSAAGAIDKLREDGAVEGVHYRMSGDGELITDFPVALDNGPLVITLGGGFDIARIGPAAKFAILNADGMEFVGCADTAQKMRSGEIPPEAAYVLIAVG